MQKKQTNFKRWVEEVRRDWKHIPSLKGKQASRNLAILKLLAIKPMSCWDLALEYLKLTEPDFAYWNPDTVFHRRQVENAKIYRRLQFLVEKEYVRKLGPIYKLTAKGLFFIFALYPPIIENMSFERLNETLNEYKIENAEKVKTMLSSPECQLTHEKLEALRSSLKDPIVWKTLSYFTKQFLLRYKINLDELSEKDFINVIFEKLEKKMSMGQHR
ncbi:hypothetical protein DRP04_04135 [Archaeoglobales archaeon]|nr:MAG: hypothetical protein DRP04_04135 [Archaeoglobales archaeon]